MTRGPDHQILFGSWCAPVAHCRPGGRAGLTCTDAAQTSTSTRRAGAVTRPEQPPGHPSPEFCGASMGGRGVTTTVAGCRPARPTVPVAPSAGLPRLPGSRPPRSLTDPAPPFSPGSSPGLVTSSSTVPLPRIAAPLPQRPLLQRPPLPRLPGTAWTGRGSGTQHPSALPPAPRARSSPTPPPRPSARKKPDITSSGIAQLGPLRAPPRAVVTTPLPCDGVGSRCPRASTLILNRVVRHRN